MVQLFLSTFTNKVDRKGRVSVPATFRAALADQSFPGIVCFPSFTSSCLEGMGIDRLETLSAGMDQFDAFSAEQDDMARLVFAQSRQLAWDPEGRIMLPEDFLEFSGISTHAAFVGMGKTFQIWEPDALDAAMLAARKRATEKRPTLRVPASAGGAE